MKKILVLISVVAIALVFSTGAFADPCSNCKCPIRNIPCPIDSQLGPATCSWFDFDLNAPNAETSAPFVADGYCGTVAGMLSTLDCRAILHICDCLPDPTVFDTSLDVGVRMSILVDGASGDNGAYWDGTAIPATILVDTHVSQADACAIDAHGDSSVPYNPVVDSAVTSGNFGAPLYYYLSTSAAAVLPYGGGLCTVPTNQRATVMEASTPGSFIINDVARVAPGDQDGEFWWIDVPPMRIDPKLVAAGATIQVKIELVEPGGGALCGSCTLCECVVDIAQVCCPAAAPVTNLVFPYFASNASYWRGIAIINPGATTGSITLTLHDVAGNTATSSASAPSGGMWVDSLDSLTWTGAADTSGRCWVSATCDIAGAEGAAMMGTGSTISMGYIVD